MSSSDQIQQRITALYKNRADIEKKMADSQKRKATKESDADAKSASAARAKSDSVRRQKERQAQSARVDALKESKKLAGFSDALAKVGAAIGTQQKALDAAKKSESKASGKMAAKDQKARDEADAKDTRQRKDAEKKRQRERDEDERRRRADNASTHARIGETEERLASEIAELREPKSEQLRILYATASPDGHRPLRVDEEMRRVREAVRKATHREQVVIEHLPAATPGDVLDYLVSFRPHVVHFSGHASESVLVFDEGTLEFGPDGGARMTPDLFKRLLGSTDEAPVLVVLNACESASHLDVLLGKVLVAVGMSAEVGDGDAIVFAARFYGTLAEGQSVDAALKTARVLMETVGMPDHDLPVLRAVEGVDPSDLRLITGE